MSMRKRPVEQQSNLWIPTGDLAKSPGRPFYERLSELLAAKWHVRHRVLDSVLGRWLRRDPLGYVDGVNLASYGQVSPLGLRDSAGLEPSSVAGSVQDKTKQRNALDYVKQWNKNIARARKHGYEKPGGPDGPEGNFGRHCVWSCLNCKRFGEWAARRIASTNEIVEDAKDTSRIAKWTAGGGRGPVPRLEGVDDDDDHIANEAGFSCCKKKFVTCEYCCDVLWEGSRKLGLPGANVLYDKSADILARVVACGNLSSVILQMRRTSPADPSRRSSRKRDARGVSSLARCRPRPGRELSDVGGLGRG